MPEVQFTIGGRAFTVSCQPGEEELLKTAAGLLDAEASVLISQVGRVPEARMLLMSGLMLADRTAELQDKLKATEKELKKLRVNPPRQEVAVVPQALTESIAIMASRAEELADRLEGEAAE